MKKVKNLEVNLKKLVAIGASILTIGTMAGCAKTEIKEEITQNPVATQPQEEPEVVVVDPNAPLFDITDEAVFNQKVDELFNVVNGLEYMQIDGNWKIAINDKEQIKKFIMLLNVESLSNSQLEYLSSFDEIDLINEYIHITYGIIEYNISNSSSSIPVENYIASPNNIKIVESSNQVVKNYVESAKLSDEDKRFVTNFVKNYIDDIKNETQNSILSVYINAVFASVDDHHFTNFGEYFRDFDEMYNTINKELPEGIVSLSYEAVNDLKEQNLSKIKSIS